MYCDRVTIRKTGREDRRAILDIHRLAFGRPDEAELAVKLVYGPETTISLLAECAGRPVGHILMSELKGPVRAMALAPLGVVPDARELQIGSNLVRDAMQRTFRAGYDAVFVLGEPSYYERFGFSAEPASPFQVPWPGPHFMVCEAREGALAGKSGRLTYPAAFF